MRAIVTLAVVDGTLVVSPPIGIIPHHPMQKEIVGDTRGVPVVVGILVGERENPLSRLESDTLDAGPNIPPAPMYSR
jgi:hypothetical protein